MLLVRTEYLVQNRDYHRSLLCWVCGGFSRGERTARMPYRPGGAARSAAWIAGCGWVNSQRTKSTPCFFCRCTVRRTGSLNGSVWSELRAGGLPGSTKVGLVRFGRRLRALKRSMGWGVGRDCLWHRFSQCYMPLGRPPPPACCAQAMLLRSSWLVC